ncbi:FAD-dependent oxidoreductase [Inquilinus sp. OTU3971]|uniref:FAD-dependent oxidoreductase n=1 Tax=Inquilinus sp. OTU3971 TaxID=3043855 RepID=UPI00313B0E74
MNDPLSIAVCGCGPAGLAAACFLHDAGHRVRLLERVPEPRPIGAGLMLQPAGLAALAGSARSTPPWPTASRSTGSMPGPSPRAGWCST